MFRVSSHDTIHIVVLDIVVIGDELIDKGVPCTFVALQRKGLKVGDNLFALRGRAVVEGDGELVSDDFDKLGEVHFVILCFRYLILNRDIPDSPRHCTRLDGLSSDGVIHRKDCG